MLQRLHKKQHNQPAKITIMYIYLRKIHFFLRIRVIYGNIINVVSSLLTYKGAG